jgi:hypothetical protein
LNAKEALVIQHEGTGDFFRFQNADSEDITLSTNGDFTTIGDISADGVLTVHGNKGIVRNSSSAQKRMETLNVDLIHFNMPVGAMVTQTVTFGQAFSAPPIVTIGNINSGFTGPCEKMTVQIKNVTNTGCTVTMFNPNTSGNPDVSGNWNLLVIGNE